MKRGGHSDAIGVVMPPRSKIGPYEVDIDLQECDSNNNAVGKRKRLVIDKVALALLLRGDQNPAIFTKKTWNHDLLKCYMYTFESGYMQVEGTGQNGKPWSGLINEQGEWLVRVDKASVRKCGNALFASDKPNSDWQQSNWQQIDRSGKVISDNKFKELVSTAESLTIAKMAKAGNQKEYDIVLLDQNGKILRKFSIYSEIRRCITAGYCDLLAAQLKSTGRWGAIASTGRIMIPFEYDGIDIWNSSTIIANKNDRDFLVDSGGTKVSPSFLTIIPPFNLDASDNIFSVVIPESKTPQLGIQMFNPSQRYCAFWHRDTGELIKTDFIGTQTRFSPPGTLLIGTYIPGSQGNSTLYNSHMKEIGSWPRAEWITVERGDDDALVVPSTQGGFRYIDLNGNLLFQQNYDCIQPFHEGFAEVRKGPPQKIESLPEPKSSQHR